MRALGFEVTEHVGNTGLVAIYKNGTAPTMIVRTELDALPMEKTKPASAHASQDKTIGTDANIVAHSRGHDIHMASWIGTGHDAGRPQGPVARHADVHRPAGRRNRCWRQGDAD